METPKFEVVPGRGGYKIREIPTGVEVGSFSDADDAEFFCERLNVIWDRDLQDVKKAS